MCARSQANKLRESLVSPRAGMSPGHRFADPGDDIPADSSAANAKLRVAGSNRASWRWKIGDRGFNLSGPDHQLPAGCVNALKALRHDLPAARQSRTQDVLNLDGHRHQHLARGGPHLDVPWKLRKTGRPE